MRAAWAVLAAGLLVLKLFTYEYYLPDDPTGGVALRAMPGMVSRQHLQAGDRLVLSDENEFVGAGVYRAAVGWGYLAVLGAGVVVFGWRRLRVRRR
ncbi:MAG: hypothetical protein JNK87_11300 [Bryobacterales bacterium]|nr:hypothetical protein [Bryobacterales bacterium]